MSESRREEWAEEGPSLRSEPDGRRAGRPLVTRGKGYGGAREARAIGVVAENIEHMNTARSAGSELILTGQRPKLVASPPHPTGTSLRATRPRRWRAEEEGRREVSGVWWWQQWEWRWQPVTC